MSLGTALRLSAILALPLCFAGIAQAVTFTEINLNWFGIDGSPSNDAGNEPRVPTVKQFLKDNHLMADVMAFEEIVDLDMLQNDVLDGGYDCHSYERSDAKHQHVVLCTTHDYTLDQADDADSYALETVDTTGHLRPAVHGILKNKNGKRLAHVFGVHLKAMPDKSDVRLAQVQALADYLGQQTAREPVIILGDFNTYANDPADFQNILGGTGLAEATTPEPYSWASATESFDPAKFDRTWMSRELLGKIVSDDIVGPCSSGDVALIGPYNTQVSDHCATSLSVGL